MAKEKKRGFFSWLGFGQKEQTPEKETEVQNEQSVVEEIVQVQEPAKASEQAVEEQPQAGGFHGRVCCARIGRGGKSNGRGMRQLRANAAR